MNVLGILLTLFLENCKSSTENCERTAVNSCGSAAMWRTGTSLIAIMKLVQFYLFLE